MCLHLIAPFRQERVYKRWCGCHSARGSTVGYRVKNEIDVSLGERNRRSLECCCQLRCEWNVGMLAVSSFSIGVTSKKNFFTLYLLPRRKAKTTTISLVYCWACFARRLGCGVFMQHSWCVTCSNDFTFFSPVVTVDTWKYLSHLKYTNMLKFY